LNRSLGFTEIAAVVGRTMEKHIALAGPGLSDILAADQWARITAEETIKDLVENRHNQKPLTDN